MLLLLKWSRERKARDKAVGRSDSKVMQLPPWGKGFWFKPKEEGTSGGRQGRYQEGQERVWDQYPWVISREKRKDLGVELIFDEGWAPSLSDSEWRKAWEWCNEWEPTSLWLLSLWSCPVLIHSRHLLALLCTSCTVYLDCRHNSNDFLVFHCIYASKFKHLKWWDFFCKSIHL